MSKSDEIRAALREADEPIDSQQIADECPSVTSNSEASALLNYMVGNGTVKKSLRADGTLGIRAGETQVRLAKPLVQRLQAFLKTTAPLWQ